MALDNKTILQKANAALSAGDNEGFLHYCTDDTVWNFIGEQTIMGKDAVREYMAEAYTEPPKFTVEKLIAEDEFVIALGKITIKDETGKMLEHAYCDVWRFRDKKMAELKAYVIVL